MNGEDFRLRQDERRALGYGVSADVSEHYGVPYGKLTSVAAIDFVIFNTGIACKHGIVEILLRRFAGFVDRDRQIQDGACISEVKLAGVEDDNIVRVVRSALDGGDTGVHGHRVGNGRRASFKDDSVLLGRTEKFLGYDGCVLLHGAVAVELLGHVSFHIREHIPAKVDIVCDVEHPGNLDHFGNTQPPVMKLTGFADVAVDSSEFNILFDGFVRQESKQVFKLFGFIRDAKA